MQFHNYHYSDLLRIELLTTIGGLWVDSTILMTKKPFFVDSDIPLFAFKDVSLYRKEELPIAASSWLIYSNGKSNILHLREDAQDFSNLILQTCDRLKDLLTMFKSNGKISDMQDLIIEINRIEGLGDELYQKSMKSLMTDENNPIIIIKWVNLYSSLEDCLDQGEVIANCIEKNIIKRG